MSQDSKYSNDLEYTVRELVCLDDKDKAERLVNGLLEQTRINTLNEALGVMPEQLTHERALDSNLLIEEAEARNQAIDQWEASILKLLEGGDHV